MSNVNLNAIYNAITGDTLPVGEYETLDIHPSTSTQTFTPSDDSLGYSEVTCEAVNLETLNVTPSTSAQSITPSTGLGFDTVNVSAVNLQSKVVSLSTSSQSITPDSGYLGLSDVTVPGINLQTKTATPTSSQQIITPDAGYDGLSEVTVDAASGGSVSYYWVPKIPYVDGDLTAASTVTITDAQGSNVASHWTGKVASYSTYSGWTISNYSGTWSDFSWQVYNNNNGFAFCNSSMEVPVMEFFSNSDTNCWWAPRFANSGSNPYKIGATYYYCAFGSSTGMPTGFISGAYVGGINPGATSWDNLSISPALSGYGFATVGGTIIATT